MTPILAFSLGGIGSTAMVVFGIGFLIFFHELGHFLAAKAAGVRVHAFAIGMGPRIWGWRRGDTDYKLCLLPIGGYVRMHGEIPGEGDPNDPGSLTNKSVGWRFLIFSGGVLMNLLFALIVFPIIFLSGVKFTAPVFGQVAAGGAAWLAGLQPEDRVVAIDGSELYSFEQLALESALAGDEGLDFKVRRAGREFDVHVTPQLNPARGAKTLGVQPPASKVATIRLKPGTGPARKAGLRDGDRILRWNGKPFSPAVEDDWLREVQIEPAKLSKPLKLVIARGEEGPEALIKECELVPLMRDGPKRLGVMLLSTRVAGLRDEGDASLRKIIEASGLVQGDVIVGFRARPGASAEFVLDETMLQEKLAGVSGTQNSGLAQLEVLRVAPGAKTRSDAKRTQLDVPLGFCGPQGAARFARAVGLGLDSISARVYPQPGLAAAKAGMGPGDRLLAIDGEDVRSWNDLTRLLGDAIKAEKSQVQLRWMPFAALDRGLEPRSGEALLQPIPSPDFGFEAVFTPRLEVYRTEGVLPSLRAGLTSSIDNLRRLYLTLKRMIGGSVSATNLGGIITISVVSYNYANSGWERFLWFLAFLSLNLAFINILPIPVLDGGHLLFLLIEKIKGSPVSVRVMTYAQVLGVVVVLGLLVFVTFNDIARLLR